MKAVILAGGENSRFWPLSQNYHKSLMKIMGKPIIFWTIESIKKSGIEDIIIVESSKCNIRKIIGDGKEQGVSIEYVIQNEQVGMGNALTYVEKIIDDDFLVLNPNYVNIEELIGEMIEKQKETFSEMVLVGTKTGKPWNYGIVGIADGKVKKIIEKPKKGEEPSDIKVVGIYLLPKNFFEYYRRVNRGMYDYEEALQLIIENNETRIVILEKETTTLKYPWDIFGIEGKIMDSNLNSQYISKSSQI